MSQPNSTALIPEWVAQSAVLLAWPYAEGDFSPWLTEVEKTYVEIGFEIQAREILIIACRNAAHKAHIEALLTARGSDLTHVRCLEIPYNDVWVRDSAPLTVSSAEGVRLLDFRFNGWGGKYEYADDARLAQNVYASGILGDTPLDSIDFVLEGGSVETDGAGVILTTSRCLLNPNRNPSCSKDEIEAVLKTRLGAQKVLWLDRGHAEGDDTDAHIDTLARFCSEDTIAYTACTDLEDPLFEEFKAMEDQLDIMTTCDGTPYRLVPLPMPKPILSEEGGRLPATYANFLIINKAVLVPVYQDPMDKLAMERLRTCFPDRELVPIDCVPLIRQYGSLHCMTMQFPEAIDVK